MKIDFRTKYRITNPILGSVWAIMFVLQLVFKEELQWVDYGWVLLSAGYFSIYLYQRLYGYLIVEDGYLLKNGPLGQRMALAEIGQVRKFAGEYILSSGKAELRVDTQIMAPEPLPILLGFLENLDVEWQ